MLYATKDPDDTWGVGYISKEHFDMITAGCKPVVRMGFGKISAPPENGGFVRYRSWMPFLTEEDFERSLYRANRFLHDNGLCGITIGTMGIDIARW